MYRWCDAVCFFVAGSLAAVRIILDIGGKQCIHDQDYQSRNALHLATIGGHGDVVNFLLENGGMVKPNCITSSIVEVSSSAVI